MRSIIQPPFPSLLPCVPLHHRPLWSPPQARQLPPESGHHHIQPPILPLPLLQASVQLRDSSMQLPVASVQLPIASVQLLVLSLQLSVASMQLSVLSLQLTIPRLQLGILRRQPGLVRCCFACSVRHSIDSSIEWNQGELHIK